MWYQNFSCMFFRFVTKHTYNGWTDRQTDGANYDPQDNASIAASCGKNVSLPDLFLNTSQPYLLLLAISHTQTHSGDESS